MILDKETFEKFGYLPKNLLPNSRKRILHECRRCNRIKAIRRSAVGLTDLCRSCFLKTENSKGRIRITLTEENYRQPTILELCDLYFCGSFGDARNPKSQLDNKPIRYRILRKNKGRCYMVPTIDCLSIMKYLGITSLISRKEFKKLLGEKLIACDKPDLFKVLCYIMENYRTLSNSTYESKDETKYLYLISDGCGIIRQMFDKLEFKWSLRNKNQNIILIRSASLFINNHWIHV